MLLTTSLLALMTRHRRMTYYNKIMFCCNDFMVRHKYLLDSQSCEGNSTCYFIIFVQRAMWTRLCLIQHNYYSPLAESNMTKDVKDRYQPTLLIPSQRYITMKVSTKNVWDNGVKSKTESTDLTAQDQTREYEIPQGNAPENKNPTSYSSCVLMIKKDSCLQWLRTTGCNG